MLSLQALRQAHRLSLLLPRALVAPASTRTLSSEHGAEHGAEPHHNEDSRDLQKQILRESHAVESAAAAFFEGQALAAHGRVDIATFQQQEQEALNRLQELLPACRVRPSLLQGVLKAAGLGFGTLAGLAPRNINLAVMGAVQDSLQEHYNDALRDIRAASMAHEDSMAHEESSASSSSSREGFGSSDSEPHDWEAGQPGSRQHEAEGWASSSGRSGGSEGGSGSWWQGQSESVGAAEAGRHRAGDEAPGAQGHPCSTAGVREVLRELRDFERAPHGAPTPLDITAAQRLYDRGTLTAEEAAGLVTKICGQVARNMLHATKL